MMLDSVMMIYGSMSVQVLVMFGDGCYLRV